MLLNTWVKGQRSAYKNTSYITNERKQKLESLKGWYWDDHFEMLWDNFYKVLIDYEKKFKTTHLPARIVFNDLKLGEWTLKQRRSYQNKDSRMTKERIRKLELLKTWIWVGEKQAIWQDNFNKLRAFIKIHKRFPKATERDGDGFDVGQWLSNQKRPKKNFKDKIKLFKSIGIEI